MIYTSYFGNLKNLPDNIIPISISGKAPDWYTGLQYKKLAPKYRIFSEWKMNHDNKLYEKYFNDQVLTHLDPKRVLDELKDLCGKKFYDSVDIALICYEKPSDFCHRHLVAKWLNDAGFGCKEWHRNTNNITDLEKWKHWLDKWNIYYTLQEFYYLANSDGTFEEPTIQICVSGQDDSVGIVFKHNTEEFLYIR